jgi:hypothetical protein
VKILSLYDGTINSKTALRYGIGKVREKGGELVVLQVFQSGLFVDYDAGPMAEGVARAEAVRFREEAVSIIREAGQGVSIRIMSEDGEPDHALLRLAEDERADLILAPQSFKRIRKSAPCPVRLIPGNILVPVDESDTVSSGLPDIMAEAEATASKVVLLGVIPVHLYGVNELEALEAVRISTLSAIEKIKKQLAERGIDSTTVIRSGYPDEVILATAEECAAAFIMIPGSSGATPSELTKAAAILRDGPERSAAIKITGYNIPIHFFSPATTG